MKVSWEEMDEWNLKPGQRDYCAHFLIPLMRCQVSFLLLNFFVQSFRLHLYEEKLCGRGWNPNFMINSWFF